MYVKRELYLSEIVDRINNGLIKVITGLRRCGKTFLLFDIFYRYLKENGIKDKQIIKIALDNLEYQELRCPEKLYEYIVHKISGKETQYYLLVDEIQYAITDEEFKKKTAPKIYDVLNGLLRHKNLDIYVTGSNSRLLSTDVQTEFRGRGDEIRVHPFSFVEFMQAYEGNMYEGYAEFMMYGGMPLVLEMKTDAQKIKYLERLFKETYLKDVIAHNKIKRTVEFTNLLDVFASNIGCLTNFSKIENTFKTQLKSDISYNTISTYTEYLEEAFLIDEAKRYDIKGRKYIGGLSKFYFEDVGLRNARLGFRQTEPSHLMENIIYNELNIRGFNVDVGVVEKRTVANGAHQRRQLEADFVANLGSSRFYIQSAYSLSDKEKEKQEKASLKNIGDSYKKVVVVHDIVKPHYDEAGILTLSIYDFLMNPDSLLL